MRLRYALPCGKTYAEYSFVGTKLQTQQRALSRNALVYIILAKQIQ